MEKNFGRIKNYNVSVKEVGNKVVFVRKLERGGSEHSFGIHVAQIAGMPKSIVNRANSILKQLENENAGGGRVDRPAVENLKKGSEDTQLNFSSLTIRCFVRCATRYSVWT